MEPAGILTPESSVSLTVTLGIPDVGGSQRRVSSTVHARSPASAFRRSTAPSVDRTAASMEPIDSQFVSTPAEAPKEMSSKRGSTPGNAVARAMRRTRSWWLLMGLLPPASPLRVTTDGRAECTPLR